MLAVYHEKTLELIGVLDERFAERQHGPLRDGRSFELPMRVAGPALFENYVETVQTLHLVRFRPLSLHHDGKSTFILFVNCHPDDAKRVAGFTPLPPQ